MQPYSVQAAPKVANKKVEYTIDNRWNTATSPSIYNQTQRANSVETNEDDSPKDWYTRYLQGGGLRSNPRIATDRVEQHPKLRLLQGGSEPMNLQEIRKYYELP